MTTPEIPTARTLTVAELREWLKIEHHQDDPALARALRAATAEYCELTDRTSDELTDIDAMAILQRAAGMAQFRGDDQTAADTRFFDTIRAGRNPNAMG